MTKLLPGRIAALLAGLAFSALAAAQAFPNKPVKIITGYPPGGSADFLTRPRAE